MSTTVKTQQEFYEIYKNEVNSLAPEFTDFSEGSVHDILAGAISVALNEISELVVSEFAKTYFDLAEGSDLDRLAVDHFGTTFSRPEASFATGAVLFSRSANNGPVTIPVGTIVKTVKNASGVEFRFETTEEVTMTGLSVSAQVKAMVAGVSGNVLINKVKVVESALTDSSITVNNTVAFAGGKESLTDAEYREFLKAKILSLAGATEAAVKGAALSVSGVAMVALVTRERVVIDYDIANDQILAGSTYFRMPYPVLYIADENGNSSAGLIQSVKDAVFQVKAAGVKIEVLGAVAVSINWTASITLNASGPNYSELQSDLSKIEDSMREYINEQLTIGQAFNKAAANTYIISVWGPTGTNDITSFSSSVPSGNVSVAANEKLIAGTVGIE